MSNRNLTITNTLKELGVPASLLGYHYLRYAIDLMANDMSLVNKITKQLYPEVAKQFKTTISRAERAMRHAIETGWNRGNNDLQCKLFSYTVDAKKGKPTNGEFIATVADYICMIESEEMV